MRVRCHMRRAEMMDEIMSRQLRACFLSFPFALPPLVGSRLSACFGLFPPPAGRGMCGLTY